MNPLRIAILSSMIFLVGPVNEPLAPARAMPPQKAAELKGAMPAVDTDRSELSGTVAERLSAGPYTYMSIECDDGRYWVVTLGSGEQVGSTVNVKSFGFRYGFRSRRLDRTFDELRFGIVHPAD